MSKTMKLRVVTPDMTLFDGEVESISLKTVEGYEGFLPGHSWAVTLLAKDGTLTLKEPDCEKRKANISGGFIDVKDEVLVFTDKARWLEDGE